MKFSLAAIALAAAVSAQSINEIPSCARTCLINAVKSDTNCAETDFDCICKNISTIQASSVGCVVTACGESVAINQVLPAAQMICKQAAADGSASGTAPASTMAMQSSTMAMQSSSMAMQSSSMAMQSSSMAMTSSAAMASPTMAMTTSMMSPSTTMASSGNSTSSTVPVHAGAAALGSMGALAMLALGALAL